ncbi:S8 family serine peptidase [Streptomyces sp. NBRC 109706]|uniref:S8 family peptidase n=1 Tax=Streptomyces sp. NBRC 109706 TaxID=1550035 RepID=UPI00099D4B05|nr:S8 family serine peptidase [Streptomyces sp. NBRC 109706]
MGRSGGSRGRARALTLAAVTLGALLLPGGTRAALADDCSGIPATGEELPDGAGPYPLIGQLGLRQAWDLAAGEGVTVAVLDSGVDGRHPDLAGAVRRGSEFTMVPEEREFVRSTPPPEVDCVGHGTAVAGMIAAGRAEGDRMAGVAPAASIYPIRIADGVDRASPNTLAAAVDDAVDAEVDVLNLSFAYPVDVEPLRNAVARAVDAGILVIAAAGNEGNTTPTGGLMYPAAYEGVLTVGAVGADGQPLESSNGGDWVDLAGYGQEMPVPAPGGGYRVEGGTSFATAQVSGAAALVLSRFPELTAAEVAERLIASATPVGGGRGDRTGAGIVDPFGALTHLDAHTDGAAEAAARPGHIPVQAIPEDRPLLGSTAATALAVSGGLLLAVVLGLLGGPALRRAAHRGWRAGEVPEERTAAEAPPSPPPAPRLDWLGGTGPTDPTSKTSQTSRSRTR